MKKLLTYLLTFAMLIVVLIPAMEPASAAVEDEVKENSERLQSFAEPGNSSSKEVTADITVEDDDRMADPVIAVDIEWGSMHFTIVDNTTYTYEPDNHGVTENKDVQMQPVDTDGDKVKVTNHSNLSIYAEPTFEPTEEYENILYSTTTTTESLDSAEIYGEATEVVIQYMFEIIGDATDAENATLGTAKITISEQ